MYVRMCGWDGERRIKMLGKEEGTWIPGHRSSPSLSGFRVFHTLRPSCVLRITMPPPHHTKTNKYGRVSYITRRNTANIGRVVVGGWGCTGVEGSRQWLKWTQRARKANQSPADWCRSAITHPAFTRLNQHTRAMCVRKGLSDRPSAVPNTHAHPRDDWG